MIATNASTSQWFGKARRPTEAMFVILDIKLFRLELGRRLGGDFGSLGEPQKREPRQ